MKTTHHINATLVLMLFSQCVVAQSSPAGLWQTVDEGTGRPRAEVKISEVNGIFTGVIVRSLMPVTTSTIQTCEKCADDRKNKPMIGMEMIRNVRQSADAQMWEGGEILDPDKGKIYTLQLRLLDNGKKLQVRGFIGPFFRNQTWNRVE